MIGTAADTRTFTEIVPSEIFTAEPPRNSSLLVSQAVDITRSNAGTEVSVSATVPAEELASVERAMDEMIASCRRDVNRHPESSRTHLNLGLALIRRDLIEEGVAELELAISLDATDYVAANSLAAAYYNMGKLDQALQMYSKVIGNFPDAPAGYIGRAAVAIRRNEFEQAKCDLRKALQIDPRMTSASFLLAILHFREEKPQAAITALRSALRNDVRSPELNQGLAIAYLLVGDNRRAERSFRAALSVNPNLPSAVGGLANVWMEQKRFDEVIDLLSRFLTKEASYVELREKLAQAMVEKRLFRQARGQLMVALESIDQSPDANKRFQVAKLNNNIAFCFAQEGNLKEAESRFLVAINASRGELTDPYENLTRVYLTTGRNERALEIVKSAEMFGARSTGIALLKVTALLNLGKYDEALSELYGLVGKEDFPASGFAELGWLLCDWREDYDSAVLILQKGLEKFPTDPMIINNLAYAHLEKGELASAGALLEVAKAEGRDAIYLTATKGLLALAQGNVAEGERLYKDAEELAKRLGFRELALAARQKGYFEIGKALLSRHERESGLEYLARSAEIELSGPRFFTSRHVAALLKDVNE